MEKTEIIKSIAERTGESTFIKKVIENLVVPNIEDENGPRMVKTLWMQLI